MAFKDKLKQRQRIEVSIPEWDEQVFVRSLTASELADIATLTKDEKDGMLYMLHLVQKATVDQDGNQLMGPEDLEDLRANGGLLQLLLPTALKLNHITVALVNEAKKN